MISFRKHSYIFLWFALILTVGIIWVFGGDSGDKNAEIISSPVSLQPSPSPIVTASANSAATMKSMENNELVGLWIPYMSLTVKDYSEQSFKQNFIDIVTLAKEKGINALFVHVRPFSDSLYKSEYFPWSHILTGEQGVNPNFDPLKFMIDYTHENQMSFHAWINPLRVKTAETPNKLSLDNPYEIFRADNPYYFMQDKSGVYLNPAFPYVRTLIADGAAEIVKNYEIDGIHFDDYFYPSESGDLDEEAYKIYKQNVETPISLEQWRISNINAMVNEVYLKIKAENPNCAFGISPQGNIDNDIKMAADVETWCAVSGYIDYICPQLYYSFENETLGFGEALDVWMNLDKHEDLEVYVGLALYKAGTDADGGTWLGNSDIISRQINEVRAQECAGIVLYSSDYLFADEAQQEVENAMATILQGSNG